MAALMHRGAGRMLPFLPRARAGAHSCAHHIKYAPEASMLPRESRTAVLLQTFLVTVLATAFTGLG